jgi:hypothetical protein
MREPAQAWPGGGCRGGMSMDHYTTHPASGHACNFSWLFFGINPRLAAIWAVVRGAGVNQWRVS